jgi:gliding motility-associated-like protein
MHNPGAYDPNGDSLSYKLITCRGANGLDVPTYFLPSASKSLSINPVTGDLIWDSPEGIGEYNFAILIGEHRRGGVIGSIVRDMQITIDVCRNRPPELDVPEKVCVFVGDTLIVPVRATDPDTADILTLSATGGILLLTENAAKFSGKVGKTPVYDTLIWTPQHVHVQNNPYAVYFRARDNGSPNLNTMKTMFVQVVGRAPQWTSITPSFDNISLSWTPILDANIFSYRIYRAEAKSGIVQDSCDFGFNDASYQLLVEFRDYNISEFTDTAVEQNMQYCYRIVAVYRNLVETQMSEEICGSLLSNVPILEKVSVETTESFNGKINLAWRKPLDFDVTSNPNNFRYIIHRSLGANMFQAIDTLEIGDTTYLDERLNTLENYYHYKIELIQHTTEISIGFSRIATSVFANATGRNRRVNVQWQSSQPWRAEGFTIYRKKNWQLDFDSIFHTNQTFFTDTNVVNDSSYIYKIEAFGRHYNERINDYVLINWSQETRATPQIDTPCRQELVLDFSQCKPAKNELSWMPEYDCMDDNPTYHIFYKASINEPFREIEVQSWNRFVHEGMPHNIGCYYVVARNIRGVFGEPSDTVCVDSRKCMDYELPNVFTPNGDGINDVFKALPNEYSGMFTIKIFSRWGNIVFESNDSDFEWDGNHHTTKQSCPEGVYFYVVELAIQGMEGLVKETLSGSVTLLR